jgi:hypothetical protein
MQVGQVGDFGVRSNADPAMPSTEPTLKLSISKKLESLAPKPTTARANRKPTVKLNIVLMCVTPNSSWRSIDPRICT